MRAAAMAWFRACCCRRSRRARARAAAQPDDEPPPRLRHKPPRKKIARPQAPARIAKRPIVAASALLNLPPRGETRLVAREALVVFKPGVSPGRIAALARRQKLEDGAVSRHRLARPARLSAARARRQAAGRNVEGFGARSRRRLRAAALCLCACGRRACAGRPKAPRRRLTPRPCCICRKRIGSPAARPC